MSKSSDSLINGDFFVASVARDRAFAQMITEKENSGKMDLTVFTDDAAHQIKLLNQSPLYFLRNRRCADGAIFVRQDNGLYRLYIFELKRKIKQDEWQKIKDQFQGAFFICLCVARLLGWEIDHCIELHTVYHEDKMPSQEFDDTNFELDKIETDLDPKTKDVIDEWNENSCQFPYPKHLGTLVFNHKKIPLPDIVNGIPQGEFSIT